MTKSLVNDLVADQKAIKTVQKLLQKKGTADSQSPRHDKGGDATKQKEEDELNAIQSVIQNSLHRGPNDSENGSEANTAKNKSKGKM